MTQSTTLLATAAPAGASGKYNYPIGYLRAFIVALVVAHHAVLAYHPFAPPPPVSLAAQPRWWGAFPVVDSQRWTGFSLFAGFNDVFFMSLMFFLSGLFVWHGLLTKGSKNFLRGRFLRLGLPFVISAAVLAPFAYYPAYLQTSHHSGVGGFLRQWISLGQWPAGPAWFVWVLFVFDCVAALLFRIAPTWGATLGRIMPTQPAKFFALLVTISALAYIPIALIFSPLAWSGWGPFAFQSSRPLHYLAYFLMGVAVGAVGLDQGLLAVGGKLARRWFLWALRALLAFGAASVVTVIALTSHATSPVWSAAMDVGFVVSCAATCLAFLAMFIRFARSRSPLFDSLAENSYAIYLVHYAFVAWLQYALLPAAVPAAVKGLVVFLGALALSWAAAIAIRRIPAARQIV
jgi:peptidoglycan/LPS O-acetylase OafA/YrhL